MEDLIFEFMSKLPISDNMMSMVLANLGGLTIIWSFTNALKKFLLWKGWVKKNSLVYNLICYSVPMFLSGLYGKMVLAYDLVKSALLGVGSMMAYKIWRDASRGDEGILLTPEEVKKVIKNKK